MSETLYFEDFLLESDLWQCIWCGWVGTANDFRVVKVDLDEIEAMICKPCLEAYDHKHCQNSP